ncbi:accessory factor UbiK family protein [Brevundimonas subvibrioides]|uniref:accessory factor UbiK family protein n=1 Tax=Brevundimonas subvibrioides TaxID=74313 RepID=UPI0022B3B211|nr:accessory factor UbiK family protein [Brevundimonas subvibrioides]
MQTRNPFLDEFAKLSTSAMGLAQAAGDEAKAAFRAQSDRIAAEMDLVRRDEFDVLKAQITALRAEVAELQKAATAKPKAPKTGTSTDGTRLPDAAG